MRVSGPPGNFPEADFTTSPSAWRSVATFRFATWITSPGRNPALAASIPTSLPGAASYGASGDSIGVLMPINSPCEFTSAPPGFPGLIAASVWMSKRHSRCGWPRSAFPDRICARAHVEHETRVAPEQQSVPNSNCPRN